jgi:hypothetical protein
MTGNLSVNDSARLRLRAHANTNSVAKFRHLHFVNQ